MRRILSVMVIVGAVSLIGWLSGLSWAQTPTDCPRRCPKVCVPNVWNFGYYEPTWRRWPGERRVDELNPRKINAEEIHTPKGHEVVPPPKAKSIQPQPPIPLPEQGETLPLPEGAIVPPEGLLLPPGNQPMEMPMEPLPSEQTTPSYKNILPGLPKSSSNPNLNSQPKEQAPGNSSYYNPQPIRKTEPVVRENNIVPLAKQMEPERGSRYAAPRHEQPVEHSARTNANGEPETVAPVAGNLEPERRYRYTPPRRESPVEYSARTNTNDPQETVAPVVGNLEPERNTLSHQTHYADSIASSDNSRSTEQVEPAAYATAETPGMALAEDKSVAPPVALNGYCPVELISNGRWAMGDLRWTVVHKGLIYRLSGNRQRQEFLADPDRFAPIDSGKDRVTLVDRRAAVPGRPEFCAIYNGRLFMFSSAENQARFNADPQRYAAGK